MKSSAYQINHTVTLASVILAALLVAACGSSGSDPTVVVGDFTAYGVKGTVNGQNISIDLSGLGNCATTVENMVIGINASGASISPDPTVARSYSQPVQFTLTAADGSKVVYTVTVKGAACLSTPTPTPAPEPVATCTPGAVLATRFREVYKACAAGVNTNYDRTECVKDSTTGLTWEGKPNTGPRQSTNSYTNYDDLTKLQVFTFVGNTYRVPTAAEISAATNTVGFVAAVNATNLCGYSNWRLPTKTELLGIVDASSAPTGPTVNTAWFPNTQANGYWTSDAFLTDETAVGVYFNLGLDTNFSRTYNARVRLVRN